MNDTIHILHPDTLRAALPSDQEIYISDDFAFLYRISGTLATQMQQMASVPQFVEVGRLIRITQGEADFRVNMLPFHLQKGDVLIIPENSYIEIVHLTEDFDEQIISFKNLPISFARCTLLSLDKQDFERTRDYLQLIWQVLHKPSFSMQTVEYLLAALMNDLQHLQQYTEQATQKTLSHSQQQIQQFTDLVAAHGATERNVSFYAEKMALTPNHLSALVRKHTGKSVMQWLNERTLLQAKVLLKHTDRQISDIAFDLNFTETTLFSRFFRRETNQTPTEYRESK